MSSGACWPAAVDECVRRLPHPVLFAALSGAHLYGFASPDSDWDVRGCLVLPARAFLGLGEPELTFGETGVVAGAELDVVCHDVKKFFGLLLRPNGYVLEQLWSPLVVHALPEFAELRAIARGCVTRRHWHHYAGFARNQWRLFEKEEPRRVKPLLYVYRVLLTGIRLLRTGEVEAHLPRLNEEFRLSFVDELIGRKSAESEATHAAGIDVEFHHRAVERLLAELDAARDASPLPERPSAAAALEDLLLRLRGFGSDRGG